MGGREKGEWADGRKVGQAGGANRRPIPWWLRNTHEIPVGMNNFVKGSGGGGMKEGREGKAGKKGKEAKAR